ncbi:Uncharacterized protein Rs2_06593 [Raphanus sativus]|nr:Uncharacterized protein Rs2_06593 [Raphanus sativus]
MAHRFSRAEKGKWKDEQRLPKKPLVRIPEADVSDLIDRNRFTLIGRVISPAIQKTRALVDFFLQHWNVVGRITGRDLGPNLFQFCFESERDMQVILAKAPFHFKRWMLILQKWEPIVSDNFPSRISFWIQVHGIPLHYWIDGTINAIGAVLGPIEAREVDKARLRVQINGLQALIMCMDLELPSKEVVEIVLEYEHLEKHCFYCKPLTHEDGDCPSRPSNRSIVDDRRQLDISQQNTLESIEEARRRQAERKFSRNNEDPHRGRARWTNYRASDTRNYRTEGRAPSRKSADRSSGFEENRRRCEERYNPGNGVSLSRRSPARYSHKLAPAGHDTQDRCFSKESSRKQSPPAREAGSQTVLSPSNTETGKRQSNIRATNNKATNNRATNQPLPRANDDSSEDRRPAKERLSVNTLRNRNYQRVITSESGSPSALALTRSLPTPPLLLLEVEPSLIQVSPPTAMMTRRRSSIASRLSDPITGNALSEDQLSAKERLSVQTRRISQEGVSQMEGDDTYPHLNATTITRPSSSKVFNSGRLGPSE